MRFWTGLIFVIVALLPYMAMVKSSKSTLPEAGPQGSLETLTIISPHRREVRLEYSRAFKAWMAQQYNRSVYIRWLDVGGTSKILKDLESRFAATPDTPDVDLLFGGGVAPYLTAREKGWIAPVSISTNILAAIPKICAGGPVYDPDGYWYGVALSGFGILYNRPLVERMKLPIPRGWEDMAKPEYFTWVSSGDPRSSGSIHMCYEIILQAYGFEKGWNLITRLCANVRNFGEAGGTGPREVSAGEVAAGLVIDQYAQTVINAVGDQWMIFVLPARTTVVTPDAIAMIRNAPNPDLAKSFMEFALSPEGQCILFQSPGRNGQKYGLYRMPVRLDSYHNSEAPRANPYQYQSQLVYNNSLGSDRWNILNDLMGVWHIEAHSDLVRAWSAIIKAGCPEDLIKELGAIPVAETEIHRLSGQWKDSRVRLDVMRQWAQRAQERYGRIHQTAQDRIAQGR